MRTIQITLYRFGELPPTAKEKARQWWRECQYVDTSWSEYTIEEAVEQGRHLGITFKERRVPLMNGKTRSEPCIWFRGFSSQGDGACFEGTWNAADVKAENVADGWGESPDTSEIKRIASEFKHIADKYPSASFTVRHTGRYNHEHCTEFECSPGEYDDGPDSNSEDGNQQTAWFEDFPEADLIEAAKDFMRWIYKQLNAEWDYQNSDEVVDESIGANEYEFYEDGTRARE